MVASIPASSIVNVVPNVLSAGGTGLDLSGLILTANTRVPIGQVLSFTSPAAVSAFFGPSAAETALAAVYFAGPNNATIRPAAFLFAQYPTVAVPAYLRGGNVSGLTLTQLQALSGTVIITINGIVFTSGTIDLSGATSFSNAAALIQAGLAAYAAVGTAAIAGTTMTVSAVASGAYAVGQVISGSGVTAGTVITGLGTGTGGTGTYQVSPSQTASSTTISAGPTTVAYDSVSGAFVISSGTPGVTSTIGYATGTLSTALALTSAAGAVLSQGAPIGVPATNMAAIIAQTQNFASFTTIFEPSTADCVAFAAWVNGTSNRYLYACWDTDINASLPAQTGTVGALIAAASYSGTALIYEPSDLNHAIFLLGAVASLDFGRTNGRATMAFRSESGITPGVTSQIVADQLIANGYNFYGSYATANDTFNFFYPGTVSGPFEWIDTYVNQIWMNNGFQLALMDLATSANSIPYNAAGYAQIEAALDAQIEAALTFGAIRAGVVLSASQASQVNAAAGIKIDDIISQRGWYLQVAPASAQVRAARGSPTITFWYTDGQSIQKITLASVEIQ